MPSVNPCSQNSSAYSTKRDAIASFASLIESFEAEINRKEEWYQELGYIPGEHLEFRSKIHHWKEKPNTQCMAVQITGELTEGNVDIQVRLTYSTYVVPLIPSK
jgi:hypothetical protein